MKRYDVIVVGSGIAGMTAAIYLKRSNLNVMIMEKDTPGGQITKAYKVENYPGFTSINGADLAYNIYEQTMSLNVDFVYEEALRVINTDNGLKKVITANSEYLTSSILIATGRSPKGTNALGEELYIGKGISYCATCDGALYKDREIVVIGGGNSAVGEAIYLAGICKKVTLLHRGDIFKAEEERVLELRKLNNVEILLNTQIMEYIGNDGVLSEVLVKNNLNDDIKSLSTSAVFLFVGSIPNSELFKDFSILNKFGYINVDSSMRTCISGIYACGDAINKEVYQLVTASAEGAIAANSIKKDLEKSK